MYFLLQLLKSGIIVYLHICAITGNIHNNPCCMIRVLRFFLWKTVSRKWTLGSEQKSCILRYFFKDLMSLWGFRHLCALWSLGCNWWWENPKLTQEKCSGKWETSLCPPVPVYEDYLFIFPDSFCFQTWSETSNEEILMSCFISSTT